MDSNPDGPENQQLAARLRTVEEHVRRENEHDLAGIMATFADEAKYDDSPWDDHRLGRDAVEQYYRDLLAALPDLHIDVRNRLVTEDAVVLEVLITGTQTGTWRGLPATGRPVRFPLCAIYRFAEDGQLASEKIYYDRAGVLRQVGLYHEPVGAFGRLVTAVTHPLTLARAYGRKLLRRAHFLAALLLHLFSLAPLLLLPVAWIEAQKPPKTWRVSEPPRLSIGSRDAEGPELFGSIAGAVRLSSGVIVVADRKSLELRLFSPTGEHLKTIGRKGGGPGEFQYMSPIQRCAGDSVFVYDFTLWRMSVFSPEGAYIRTADVRKWSTNGRILYNLWCNPAGVFAFVHKHTDQPKGIGPWRPSVTLSLVGPGDSVVGLGTFPASDRYFNGQVDFPMYLGKETTIGVGSRFVYVGTGDAYEVAEYSLQGKRIGGLGEVRAPIPVTAAQVTTFIAEHIAARDERTNTSEYEKLFRGLDWPKVYPAHGKLMVDGSDNLWIEEYPIPGRNIRDWTIYARTGGKIATVSLPKGFRLLEAGSDYVLGIWRDEADVDYLRVYTLVK